MALIGVSASVAVTLTMKVSDSIVSLMLMLRKAGLKIGLSSFSSLIVTSMVTVALFEGLPWSVATTIS